MWRKINQIPFHLTAHPRREWQAKEQANAIKNYYQPPHCHALEPDLCHKHHSWKMMVEASEADATR